MSKLIAVFIIAMAMILLGCSEEFRAEDYNPGPNGEPPKKLELVYSKEIIAEEKNYVRALGEIHAFLVENDFSPIYRSCFTEALDVRLTIDPKRQRENFPCVVIMAVKGAPTKIYLSVVIEEIKFNQLNDDNRLVLTVSMYGLEDLVGLFSETIEPNLFKLYQAPPSNSLRVAP